MVCHVPYRCIIRFQFSLSYDLCTITLWDRNGFEYLHLLWVNLELLTKICIRTRDHGVTYLALVTHAPSNVSTTIILPFFGPASHMLSDVSTVASSPSRTRYAQVAQLVAENPEMKTWVQSLASDLTQHNFVVTDNFLERDMAVKLAVEVRKAWKHGKLETGVLAGGRSGKLTRYTLENIRGDKVGWFSGDPCHDTSTGREEAAIDPETTGRCWYSARSSKILCL